MAVRYTIPFKDYDNSSWRIDISDNSASATAVTLTGQAKQVCILSYDGETDDPYGVFIKSRLDIALYDATNLQIDINELQNAQDKDFKVSLYKGTVLKWIGYLQIEGIQRQLLSAPTRLNLTAFDGLSMLHDIDYTHNDLITGGRAPINYFRQILFATANLGLPLPIRWTNTLQCSAFLGEDVFAGSIEWATDNQGFYSYQATQSNGDTGTIKKCGEILEEMLRSMQCRIYQADGKWIIRRINDVVAGTVAYSQTEASLGPLFVNTGSENLLKQIGRTGYRFQNKDALITTKQGLKSVTVEYEANVRENILPNGSQDITETDSSAHEVPVYWGFYEEGTEGNGYYRTHDQSLTERPGKSVRLFNGFGGLGTLYYTLKVPGGSYGNSGLPIDTNTLAKKISLSFYFSPEGGFVTDEGKIVWDSEPFKIQLIYNQGVNKWYLNEFGYWQTAATEINIVIEEMELGQVARVAFDKFQGIIMPTDGVQPEPGDVSNIIVAFRLRDDQSYFLDNISISIENANDVYESIYTPSKNTTTENKTLKISSSFGGYMVSNFMTSWDQSGEECFFKDGLIYEGTLTGLTANAMMRLRYKASKIFNGTLSVRNGNWNFDQIYLIDTFGTEKYLPLNARYNVETCEVNLVAFECRNDQIELTEKYYSSNDKTLSN